MFAGSLRLRPGWTPLPYYSSSLDVRVWGAWDPPPLRGGGPPSPSILPFCPTPREIQAQQEILSLLRFCLHFKLNRKSPFCGLFFASWLLLFANLLSLIHSPLPYTFRCFNVQQLSSNFKQKPRFWLPCMLDLCPWPITITPNYTITFPTGHRVFLGFCPEFALLPDPTSFQAQQDIQCYKFCAKENTAILWKKPLHTKNSHLAILVNSRKTWITGVQCQNMCWKESSTKKFADIHCKYSIHWVIQVLVNLKILQREKLEINLENSSHPPYAKITQGPG